MADASTFERVVKILQEEGGVDNADITPETKLSDLGLDSLAIVEGVMACEDEFGIEIDADEAPETVGDIVKIIEPLL